MGATKIIRELTGLHDVDPSGLANNDVPTWKTAVSSFQMLPAAGGGAFSGGVSNIGNTLGDTGVTGTRLVLAGGNNVTLSQATDAGGGTITISGPAAAAPQTGISGIANSQTTFTSGTVSLSELGAITIRSTTGNQLQLSVNPQSVQPETQTAISGIANSQTTFTSGTVSLSELGAITIRSTTGNQLQLSVNPQSVQPETQTAISGIANSQTTFTSGTVSLSEIGAITIRSTTGNQYQLSVNAQSVQTQQNIQSIAASDTTYHTGQVQFTGSNMVTVKSSANQRVVIDATQSVQTQNLVDVTLSGNTAGALALISSGTMTLAGGNNITVSQNGNAVTISGPNVAGAQTGISGIANSQTTYTSGTVSLSELGAITIRSTTGNQFQLSVNSQTVQTQGILSAGVSTGGNTAGNTTVNTGSRLVLVGSGNITASQGTAAGASTITLSVGTQSVQTQDVLSIGVSTGGNTSGNTTVNTGSRFVLVGTNGITASQGTAAGATTVTLSGITQSVQTQDVLSIGVSTGGNTSGDTTVNTGSRLVLVGTNGITLSQGTAAGASTITLSGPTVPAQFSGGLSNIGNSSGDTGVVTARLVLAGGNNITLSGSTNAGSMTITVSAPNLGAGAFSGGASNLGQTAGSTGVTGTRLVLVATGDQTLSQSTDANGGTLSFVQPYLSSYNAYGNQERVPGVQGQATLQMQPWQVPRAYQHDRVVLPVFYTQATNSTLTVTLSAWFGLYTKNVSTLSLLSSSSGTFSINGSGTASSANNSGWRNMTFGWTNTVPASDYYLAFVSRTTTAGNNATLSNMQISNIASVYSGIMGVAVNATAQATLGMGTYSVTTAGMPNSIGFNELTGSGSLAHRLPSLFFVSQTV